MKTNNKLIVKNPFRFYRYEVPNAYVRFAFSDRDVELRTDKNEAGWDEITSIRKFENLPEFCKIRLKPFMGVVTEQEYLENPNLIDIQDCLATQEWSINPSDSVRLLNILDDDGIDYNLPHKIDEQTFITVFISEKYYSILDKPLTIDDVESFSIKFLFCHDYATDDLEFIVENIVFKNPEEIQRVVKDDDPYHFTLYIDETIFACYFGISSPGRMMSDLLSQEYLLTPAMVLDYELYGKVKNKIEYIKYEAAGTY
jgi:hypothetical protein